MQKLLMCAALIALYGTSAGAIHLNPKGQDVQVKIAIKDKHGKTIPHGDVFIPHLKNEGQVLVEDPINTFGKKGILKVTMRGDTHAASCTVHFKAGEGAMVDSKTITYTPDDPKTPGCEVTG